MAGLFQEVATMQLKVLFCVLLLGNGFRPIQANPATSCGADLDLRVFLTQFFLILTAFAAAMLLLTVRLLVFEGLGSVPTGWQRRSLRGMLLLAVALSFAASVLAVVAFEDGFIYRTGCDAGHDRYGACSPMGVTMIGLFALLHGVFAWAVVTQN